VRVSVDCPSRVGCGELAGRTKSGFVFVAAALSGLDLGFFTLGRELRAAAVELLAAPKPPEVPPLIVALITLFEFAAGCSEETGSAAGSFAAAF
jgi:hypothetical protein